MTDIIEVIMHDVLRPDFEQWLGQRGLELQRTPFLDAEGDDDAMPTYTVVPTRETWTK